LPFLLLPFSAAGNSSKPLRTIGIALALLAEVI
jgi:hypothetical protein